MSQNIHRITAPIGDFTEGTSFTLTVTGLRVFRVRCFIVMCLLRVAGWVCPFHLNIETDERGEVSP